MEKNYLMISGEISLPLKSHKSKYPNLIYQNYQTLKIPDFPELKFPKISFPKPQPIDFPKPQLQQPSLTEQLKDIDMIQCGGASMKIVYVAILTHWRVIRDSNGILLREEPVYQQSDIETFIKAKIADEPNLANSSTEQILQSPGQSGFNYIVNEGTTVRFKSYPYVTQNASINGNKYNIGGDTYFRLPCYMAAVQAIDIRSGSSVKDVLSYL
jgi:hypothetical protein